METADSEHDNDKGEAEKTGDIGEEIIQKLNQLLRKLCEAATHGEAAWADRQRL